MPLRWNVREHVGLALFVLKWLLITAPLGAAVGSAVALFLWSLDRATQTRWEHPWLLFLLPLAGLAIGLMYHLFGRSVEGGNNLIVEQIHEPGGGVPIRMAPLVLIGTLVTHLFGGSAGREGTAVQMGGSLASSFARWLRISEADTRLLLMAGIAAGFGAVFGTPLAGAVFALEVLAIGRLSYEALIPCLAASIIGDATTDAWGIKHSHFQISSFAGGHFIHDVPGFTWLLLGKVAVAALAFGLASALFAELAHSLHRFFKWIVPWPVVRPGIGGLLVIGLVFLVGTQDYLGLGVTADPAHPDAVTIRSCFSLGGATWWSWWWKILFTAVTLSSGFKGGEVTPLFFIGAALGNSLARLMGAPVDLFAGLGFVAVFAAATNTPLACILMAIELFGPGHGELLSSGFVVYVSVACCLAYLLSGHSGIYLSQRIGTPKIDAPGIPPDASLKDARELRLASGETLVARAGRIVKVRRKKKSLVNGESKMSHRHKVKSREIGQVRIYMKPRERAAKGIKGLMGKPLYRQIIDTAQADGILNAVAHHAHYGYSGNSKLESNSAELPNQSMHLCIELIAPRDELDLFCRKHGDLLAGKVIVYKHLEHWDVHETSAKPEEIA